MVAPYTDLRLPCVLEGWSPLAPRSPERDVMSVCSPVTVGGSPPAEALDDAVLEDGGSGRPAPPGTLPL